MAACRGRVAAIGRMVPNGLVIVVLFGGGAASATPSATPPMPTTMVTDHADVLSTTVQAALTRRLGEYEARSGHQVVVWIDRSSGGVPIEQFAVTAFAAWKLGRAGLDDGLAIFAMTEDRTVRIEVGYDLESRVTDLVAATLIRKTMIPLIQRDDWDGAVVQGVESLVDTIEGQAGSLPADGTGKGDAPELGLAEKIGLGLLAAAFLVLLVTHPRRALMLLVLLGRGGMAGGGSGGGFRGGGGRSGGGGATGRW